MVAIPTLGTLGNSFDTKAYTEQWTKLAQHPFINAWKAAFFDLPLAVLSQSLSFTAHRLEAQAEYLNTVNNCKTVPEIVEAQSHFIQKATGDLSAETGRFLEEVRAKMATQAA
jgi:hypothetical protein